MEVWFAPITGTHVLVPYPRPGADADRPGRAAGDAVRLHRHADARLVDQIKLAIALTFPPRAGSAPR